jgi:enoyl-CoA hydratase/carnithine racemase
LALAQAEINGDETASWAASHAAHERLLASHDVAEGINAFFERRAPRWSGW